jgi:hypothetical protein
MDDDATLSQRALRIVLPGGSGQVGRMLADYFQQRGHHVTVLTRGPYSAPWQTVHWDAEHEGPWTETLEGADVCINLAGRNVNCRYDAAHREAIYDSRIQSTRLLGHVIARLADPPRVWLNASAATIYKRAVDADGVDLALDETAGVLSNHAPSSKPQPCTKRWLEQRNFISRVAKDWEAALFAADTPRTRKVALRSGIVLSPESGSVFAVLSNLVRAGLGGTQGNGRQFVSWIHETDYARALEFLIARQDLEGPFNMASPGPLPNRAFMAALREAWNMPNGLPAPSLFIKLGAFVLRTEPELVLQSSCVIPGRLLDASFVFEHPDWSEAADDLVRQWRQRHG